MSENKEHIKSKRKLGVKSFISGDYLQDGKVMANLPFLSFVALLMIFYIAYGYFADNTIRELSKEEKKSEQLYSELQSLMEVYDRESLQSTIAEKLKHKDIYEAKDPPRIIWLPNKSKNN